VCHGMRGWSTVPVVRVCSLRTEVRGTQMGFHTTAATRGSPLFSQDASHSHHHFTAHLQHMYMHMLATKECCEGYRVAMPPSIREGAVACRVHKAWG